MVWYDRARICVLESAMEYFRIYFNDVAFGINSNRVIETSRTFFISSSSKHFSTRVIHSVDSLFVGKH